MTERSTPSPADMPRTSAMPNPDADPSQVVIQGDVVSSSTEPSQEKSKRKDRRTARAKSGRRASSAADTVDTSADSSSVDTDALDQWAETQANNVPLFHAEGEGDDALVTLTQSRALFAETATQARTGTLVGNSNSRREKAADTAGDAYMDARHDYFASILEDFTGSDEQKVAFLAALEARENGALMGEEANYYIDRHENRSRAQKLIERYNELDKKKQVAIVLGGAALTSVALGFVAGGAAAGALIGARLGRSYFTQEAKRRGLAKTDIEKQQASTLRSGSLFDYETSRAQYSEGTYADNEELLEYSSLSADVTNVETLSAAKLERETESLEKRKAIGKAALATGLGALGGALLDELLNGKSFNGFLRGDLPHISAPNIGTWDSSIDLPSFDFDSGFSSETQAPTELELLEQQKLAIEEQTASLREQELKLLEEQQLLEEKQQLLEEQKALLAEQVAEAQQEATEHMDELSSLYGEFAGEEVSVTIPEGSNIWDQLELQVDESNPLMSDDEKQRLVGNMVHALEEQYPDRDLNLVQPGETFSVELA